MPRKSSSAYHPAPWWRGMDSIQNESKPNMTLTYKKRNGFRFLKVGRASIQFVWCKRAPIDADRAPWTPSVDLIACAFGFATISVVLACASARAHGLI